MLAIGVGGADAVDALTGTPWELKAPQIVGTQMLTYTQTFIMTCIRCSSYGPTQRMGNTQGSYLALSWQAYRTSMYQSVDTILLALY